MNRLDMETRYLNDPIIHGMVNVMRQAIHELMLTPTELRECAMLACIIEEQNNPVPLIKEK